MVAVKVLGGAVGDLGVDVTVGVVVARQQVSMVVAVVKVGAGLVAHGIRVQPRVQQWGSLCLWREPVRQVARGAKPAVAR